MTKPIPEGFHTLTPHIIVKDVGAAIDWYGKAFGAEETFRMSAPDGKSVLHAEMKIGDCVLMLGQESAEWKKKGPKSLGGTPVTLHLYVEDVDAAFKRATDAGAEIGMPVADTFWGDRYGPVADPDGHHWSIATHIADPTPEEMQKAMMEAFAQKQS
jgi:uncharacterized glyoxalase superfamily protein PhnB